VAQRCAREGDIAGHFDRDLQFLDGAADLPLLLVSQTTLRANLAAEWASVGYCCACCASSSSLSRAWASFF